jgi:predicted O-methyltransferase YrrM
MSQAQRKSALMNSDELLSRLRKHRESLLARGKIRGDNGLNDIFPIGLTAERGRVVREICLASNARRTLEIGLGWGISTLFILDALLTRTGEAAKHVAIDPFQATVFHNAARIMLRELGLEARVEIYDETSLLVLTQLLRDGRRFDFAFIDGDHRFDACFTDFCIVHHLLPSGGVVMFDDTWLDAVHLTANYAITNLGYTEFVPPCPVPAYRSRPMLRGLIKPLHWPARNGLWTESLIPFFEQPLSNAPQLKAAAKAERSVRAVSANLHDVTTEVLDLVAGKCRAARVLLNGNYVKRAQAILDEIRTLLTDLRRAIATPQVSAVAHKLLASMDQSLDTIKTTENPAAVGKILDAIEQLKHLFDQQLWSLKPAGPDSRLSHKTENGSGAEKVA